MRKLARTAAALGLAIVMSMSLGGCDFLDNIMCDLLGLSTCGATGDIGGGLGGGAHVKDPTHIGEAAHP